MSDPAIVCRGLWKIFGERPAEALAALRAEGLGKAELMSRMRCVVGLADVSLAVQRGEVFCVMGLSGSGKSTLVRHINGLIKPTAGEVLIDGMAVTGRDEASLRRLRAEKIGMVFQNFALLPHRSVLDNIAFGLELRGMPRDQRAQRAREMLELVQLEGWGDAWPDELSGGMQQRVGLARALAGGPQILLMDEPFGALDPLIRRQLQDEFKNLVKTMGMTTMFITHDLEEALRIGTRIAIMRDGAIVQVGTPADILRRPADDYVAAFTRGISALRIVDAGDIMVTAEELPAAAQKWPRAKRTSPLGALAGPLTTHEAMLVEDESGAIVGMVDRKAVLAAVGRSEAG